MGKKYLWQGNHAIYLCRKCISIKECASKIPSFLLYFLKSNFTMSLFNHFQSDKHIPMHLRRKSKTDKSKPRHFEMMPPTGTLMPGQRLNVQVKFMPTEEVEFNLYILDNFS